MNGEGRPHFHQRLESLERAVVVIGREVTRALPEATGAWLRRDCEAGQRVDARTAGWSARARDAELAAYELIATQQPMGMDLRRLTSLVRLTEDVARSGDLVAHIARSACFARHPDAFSPTLRSLVVEMAAAAAVQCTGALDAYAAGDAEAAGALEASDDDLDALQHRLVDAVLAGEVDTAAGIDLALLGRYYERIGDHAVEIARRVAFVATGVLAHDGPAGAVPGPQ